MTNMRNVILIIAGIVAIAAFSYLSYMLYGSELRKKELDKKASDILDEQKAINAIIKSKLESGEINTISPGTVKAGMEFSHSSNGKKKNKQVKLQKKN